MISDIINRFLKTSDFNRRLLILTLVWSVSFLLAARQPRYIFYCIGDGMGMNQVEATQLYLSENVKDIRDSLLFTRFPVAGFATTHSASHYITCSSAAGTALSSGVKTKNNTVGIDPEGNPIPSLIVNAQAKGWKTAVITSMSVDDATPAAFYAHQNNRNLSYQIAIQAAESGINFLGGAGLKSTKNKKSPTDPDAFDYFREKGYIIVKGSCSRKISSAEKVLMLPKKSYPDVTLPYAIDRNNDDMQLTDLTLSALEFLQKDNPKGFFMVMEGGQIDHCSHVHDAAAVVNEVIDFDKNIRLVYEFYKKYPDETLIVVTADHETGGMALGIKYTVLNLQILKNQKISVNQLSAIIRDLRREKGKTATWNDVTTLLKTYLGFWDKVKISSEEEKLLQDCYATTFSEDDVNLVETLYAKDDPLAVLAVGIMNQKAQVGWTTNSHSAASVPVYAIGVGAENFAGRMDNTDIKKRIEKLMK